MYNSLYNKTLTLLNKAAPATGIGLFRILYGLICLQEIGFLYYFNHLIFDPVPYLDVEFPTITFFLSLWGIVACFVVLGYRYQFSVICNYLFWLVFVNFTAMQRDFDGGFDLFMTGAGFFLMFMPGDRAFSLDSLRHKLSKPFIHYSSYPPASVSALSYYLPVWVCLGFLYVDSDVHKIFAEHWRNGLGAWLPSTQPYYVSAWDVSRLLNIEWLQKTIGYSIIVFQATFLWWFNHRNLRLVFLFVGISLHLGITLSLNIYPFGLGMLAFYVLLVPFCWWRRLGAALVAKDPRLIVFYDKQCPLCNRTALSINHIDIFKRIDFKNVQDYSGHYPPLATYSSQTLLTDLYAIDQSGKVYAGLDTYIQIACHLGYTLLLGWFLALPGIYQVAAKKYRHIADNRVRVCDADCLVTAPLMDNTWYHKLFEQYASARPKACARKITKVAIALAVLQMNCTLHFGLLYRLKVDLYQNPVAAIVAKGSNALVMVSRIFFGIAPHALYLHDHFSGYDRILAITYRASDGTERWLPFVNPEGRLLAPNWGRVQMMWANIAVTPNIDNQRIRKFIMKVTAFWGTEIGLDLNKTEFSIKMKRIQSPSYWVYDLRHSNMGAPWITIGSAAWKDKVITYNLPDNIDTL